MQAEAWSFCNPSVDTDIHDPRVRCNTCMRKIIVCPTLCKWSSFSFASFIGRSLWEMAQMHENARGSFRNVTMRGVQLFAFLVYSRRQ